MTKAIRIDKRGRVLEVYPWSKEELRKNTLYHPDLVKSLYDCPEPVESNWYFHGHRAYRYAPARYVLTGKRINKRAGREVYDPKRKIDTANLAIRLDLVSMGLDPDVILAKETASERAKGLFGF